MALIHKPCGHAAAAADGIGIKTLKLTVDGKDLSDVLRENRIESPYYDFTMSATDNILGFDGVTSGSSVSDGYLVILKPLCQGHHDIHFEGNYVSGPAAPGPFGVTYHLAVR